MVHLLRPVDRTISFIDQSGNAYADAL